MDRAEQLRLLAELYSRVEDGEADVLTTTVSNETFIGGARITVELYSTTPLKTVKSLAAQQVHVGAKTSSHSHSTHSPTSSWVVATDLQGNVTFLKDSQ